MASEYPTIIDSHIHLFPETHLSRLNWTSALPSDHILKCQNSVEEYKKAIGLDQDVLGFVFLETDRKFSLDEEGWKDPLEEVALLARIAQGQPVQGEGHETSDCKLVLGIVPWAPIPAGSNAVARYISKVRHTCGDEQTFGLVKGFRYLLQDKPEGTMLKPDFLSGLQWLGDNDFTFDLGVDLRQGGIHQLWEVCELFSKLFQNQSRLKVVINHFYYIEWAKCIRTFANHPSTYMKLSGLFSELPPQNEAAATSISQLAEQVKPWADVVFNTFGPARIMFGSDWPVCSVGGPGTQSWKHWVALVTAVLDGQSLSLDEKQRIWSGTAAEAYKITRSTM